MAKWIIIEDDDLKAHALINACLADHECVKDGDQIICLWAKTDARIEMSNLSKLASEVECLSIVVCQSTDELIAYLRTDYKDQLNIFLDVWLPGIQEPQDLNGSEHDNELMRTYRNIAHEKSYTNIICIISSHSQPIVVKKSLGENLPNVFASRHEISGRSYDHALNDAKSIVAELCLLRSGLLDSPLEKLWRESSKQGEEWFLKKHVVPPIPHDSIDIKNTAQIKKYKEVMDTSFGFTLPNSWFIKEGGINTNSLEVFHQNMKSLSGYSYIGNNPSGTNNLSVGSILLIAILAYYHIHNNICIFEKKLTSWEIFWSSNKPFLLSQDSTHAKQTALSFYDFFSTTFKGGHKSGSQEPSLRDLDIYNDLNKFSLYYSWKGDGIYNSLNQAVGKPSSDNVMPFPYRRYNTTSCVRWISHMMTFQTEGFYHPGHIYMRGSVLHVSSTWS